MREDRDNNHALIVAVHHFCSDIIWDRTMTKSYTVSLQILAILWVPEYFVEVGAGIWAAATQITNNIIKRHWYTTTTWEGYQKASFSMSLRLERSPHVFGTGVGDNRGKQIWKSGRFSANLGGHRPPRRIKVYSGRNIHELDIASPVPPQNMYLGMFYGYLL